VKLLTRYVIREHVGPLVFALSALTSLLMLQYVARQLGNLAGKGLPWSAIGTFFVLSLPFTIAMTMPMAVLVATLYAFGRMAAEHEITAFKASGVRVRTLMLPVLACAFLLSLGMVWFNDQVLPASNHKLRILQQDIGRTRPTLALREQVMNAVTDQFFMRVARSNATTNRIYDVTIYDLRLGPERKTIYADSGLFMTSANGEDGQLLLWNGFVQEFVRGDSRKLQRSFFRTQTVRLKGIARGFEATGADTYKGDREMTVCEMHRRYRGDALEYHRIRDEYIGYASRLAKPGQTGVRVPRERPREELLAKFYCETLVSGIEKLMLPKKVKAQQPPVQQPPVQPPVQQPPVQQQPPTRPSPDTTKPVTPVPAPVVNPAVTPAVVPGAVPGQPPATGTLPQQPPVTAADSAMLVQPPLPDTTRPIVAPVTPVDTMAVLQGSLQAASTQMYASREGLDSLAVEVHKKFALSIACFVFVLFGPPIALRFPRGGVGVTIGVSIVVFGLYYVCLMGGEALADKGRLPAYVAMWIANVIFTIVGLLMLWRVESTTDTSRGGGLRDWWVDRKARKALRELERRERAAGAGPGAAVNA
jgi:lipopolysaccharide export system permease protein